MLNGGQILCIYRWILAHEFTVDRIVPLVDSNLNLDYSWVDRYWTKNLHGSYDVHFDRCNYYLWDHWMITHLSIFEMKQ
jgi:hypothetical protein